MEQFLDNKQSSPVKREFDALNSALGLTVGGCP
jgi:hypothetical protein